MAVELATLRMMRLRATAASFRNGLEEARELVFIRSIVAGFREHYIASTLVK